MPTFTPEDIQAIAEALKPIIVETASKASADHFTKRSKSFEEKLDEKWSALQPPKPKEDEETVEKTTLTQRMVKLEQDNKRLIDQLKQEKETSQKTSMRSSLEQHLTKAGVPQHLIKATASQLIHEDKLVSIDKSGSPVFQLNQDEQVPMEEGLGEWFKGDGKAFITPPKATTPGLRTVRSNQNTKPQGTFATQEEADEALMALLRQQ